MVKLLSSWFQNIKSIYGIKEMRDWVPNSGCSGHQDDFQYDYAEFSFTKYKSIVLKWTRF